MKSKNLLPFLLTLLLSVTVYSQETNVTGLVLDEFGAPFPGANVILKGTLEGTITDTEGRYSISANPYTDTLQFSFIGMLTKEEPLMGRNAVDVTLETDIIDLDELIVIGYGTQKKKEVTGAVAQVKSEQLNKIATNDLGAALQGQVAGVNVQMSSGEPGGSSNIQIRGITSITGNNAPLFVVDGIPQESDPRLSNSEIESVDILKDAASAAIYGTRGSGGVILITTKQAKEGQLKVTADGYYGIQNITSGMPLMTTEEWTYAYFKRKQGFELIPAGTGTDVYTPLQLNQRGVSNNTNIIDQLQNNNASIQNYNITFSGGKNNVTNSVVLDYFNQDGVIINSGYERYNFRSNSLLKTDKLRLNIGIGASFYNQDRNTSLYTAYRYKPYQSPFDPNATSFTIPGASTDVQNATNLIQQIQSLNNTRGGNFSGNMQLRYTIVKGLELFAITGARFSNSLSKYMKPNIYIYDDEGDLIPPSVWNRSRTKDTDVVSTSLTGEGGLSYQKISGGHKVTLLGVLSNEKYTYTSFFAERLDLVSNDLKVLDAGSVEYMTAASDDKDRVRKIIGTLARVQYDFESRYLFSASIRRDGSSRFSKKNRWGVFPSASAGWNVSEEPFWASINRYANLLKLRASYGTTGNENFADYSYSPTIALENDYPLGREGSSSLRSGYIQEEFYNPNVKWETSSQANLGIDLGMFVNRLTFSADFYNTQKTDMLFPLLLPSSTGAADGGTVVLNVGDMVNRGMEFALGFKSGSQFLWGVNYTFTKNINEVTKMSGASGSYPFADSQGIIGINGNEDKVTYIREGYEAGAFFLMETNGVVTTEEELELMQTYVPEARMGDLFYKDQNGDNVIDEADKVYKGSGIADFEMGLLFNCSYKGIDFSMQWHGSFGNEVYNGSKAYAYLQGTHKDLLYSWSTENPNSNIPVVQSGQSAHLNGRAWADVWVEDGSFIRLRNVTIGYNLPTSMLHKFKLSKVRFYLASDNPITITKYSGFDPEVGSNGLSKRGLDMGRYPISSHYRFGIQLGF